jgi:hypothetical protein
MFGIGLQELIVIAALLGLATIGVIVLLVVVRRPITPVDSIDQPEEVGKDLP